LLLPVAYPLTPDYVVPGVAFAGRFGAAPGGGTLVIDPERLGHFFSPAETAAGKPAEWTAEFPY